MKLSLHYNPSCPKCARQAKLTAGMDWLGRVELRTDASPLGDVPAGEIVVVDKRDGGTYAGVHATRKVCLQIPLFFLYGLLLYLSPVRKLAERGGTARSPDTGSTE